MIESTLNNAQTDELFNLEAVLLEINEGVPEYRIAELFGERISAWTESCMFRGGPIAAGRDYNICGSGGDDRPILRYFYRSGFRKIVNEHNYQVTVQRHRTSEGGAIADALWKARADRLAAQDAEAKRKHQECKEKRAAAKKAKQEAEEKVSV